MALRFDPAQRFTCAGCARCCHGEVLISPAEREAYERARAMRWFREGEDVGEGASSDPFSALPGRPGWSRIRRRADGACGFLSPQNRCRLHEELGGEKKPLVCRMFPFAVHRMSRESVLTASFTCPTVAANEGEPLADQLPALRSLQADWEHVFGREAGTLWFAAGRPMVPLALQRMRERLQQLLEAPGPDGRTGLARNLRRMGAWIEDLARPRVVRLPPEDLLEYVTVTGRHAVESDRALPLARPSALSRVRARGIVFVVAAAEAQRRGPVRGLRLGLRWQLLRLLLHAHGMAPAAPALDVGARRRVALDREAATPLVVRYLRGTLETLGTGRRPVLDELGHAAAVLNAALTFGAMHALQAGETAIGAAHLREGLVRASDLSHLEGAPASIVDSFASGADAWTLLAAALGAE